MRLILLGALALSAAGCAQILEVQRQMHEQRMARIEAVCARYGFQKGTPEFGRCLMQIDQSERQAEAARQAQYQQQQNETMRTYQDSIGRTMPQQRQPLNCTSSTHSGTTYTNCY